MKDVILAIIASGAVFSFLQFILQFVFSRLDNKHNLGRQIEALSEKVDRNQAILARTHILRFADDLRNGIEHSEEYFRQQMLDCDTYDHYCSEHPEFSNGLTIVAADFIKEEFRKKYTSKGE